MELNTIQPMDQYNPATSRSKKVGKDFEAFFLYQVLELMQPELNRENPLYGGAGEEMFRHILNEHIAAEMSERGGIGIRESVEDQIAKYRKAAQ
jgi:Rod binding domain-containing protein